MNNMNMYEREIKSFRKLNTVANANGVVIFGSSFAKEIPVCELKQTFNIECDLYNRSLTDLSIFSAGELLQDCVCSLLPKKVLLQLGETDLEQGYHTLSEIINAYENLIAKLRSADKHCKIVIVSVCENENGIQPEKLNKELEKMAYRLKCQYADITPAFSNDSPYIKAFSLLKGFILDRISFYDAICLNPAG